jgi:hypothetical protein
MIKSRALVDVDGRAVAVLIACEVPGCTVGQFVSPGGGDDHAVVAGHQPVAGRFLVPLMAVGT